MVLRGSKTRPEDNLYDVLKELEEAKLKLELETARADQFRKTIITQLQEYDLNSQHAAKQTEAVCVS